MSDYISEITPEMTATVDKLKATNFEGATPEEIEIYAQFNIAIAKHEQDMKDKAENRKRLCDEQIKLSQEQAQKAMNALDALTELAKAKLKAVENES